MSSPTGLSGFLSGKTRRHSLGGLSTHSMKAALACDWPLSRICRKPRGGLLSHPSLVCSQQGEAHSCCTPGLAQILGSVAQLKYKQANKHVSHFSPCVMFCFKHAYFSPENQLKPSEQCFPRHVPICFQSPRSQKDT